MPSADFCPAVRPPLDDPSRRSDTEQISWGKFSRLPCTIVGSTLRTLDGYGLRGESAARPMHQLAPIVAVENIIDGAVACRVPDRLLIRRLQIVDVQHLQPRRLWQ